MISIIIPFRLELEDRLEGLAYVLQHYRKFQIITELILIEQDESPKIPQNIYAGIKYFFVYNKGLFNRSWAFNVGARHATYPILAFCDADIVMPESDFMKAVNAVNRFHAVNPYCRIFDLSESLTTSIKTSADHAINNLQLDKHSHLRDGVNFSGGILLMQKDAFFRINGWPEEIRGWGTEDNIMTFKIEQQLTHETIPSTAYHLFHGPSNQRDHPFFEVNRFIWKQYVAGAPLTASSRWIGRGDKFTGVRGLWNDFAFQFRYRRLISSHYHHRLLRDHDVLAGLKGLAYNPFSIKLVKDVFANVLGS